MATLPPPRTLAPKFGAFVEQFNAPSIDRETKKRIQKALLAHTPSDTLRVTIKEMADGLHLRADNPIHQLNWAKKEARLPYNSLYANTVKNVELVVRPQDLLGKLPVILHVLGATAQKELVNFGEPIIFEGKKLGFCYIDLTA